MSDKPRTYPGGVTREEWIAYWDDNNNNPDDLPIEVIISEDIQAAMQEIVRQDTEIATLTRERDDAREAARYVYSAGDYLLAARRWPWLRGENLI